MPSNIWISSIASGTSTDFYLSATAVTKYTGSGTPWTAQGTTPYRLAMNDVTGPRWTPTAAVNELVFGGGAPLFEGAPPIYDAYGNIVETFPLQCYANNFDNAMALVRLLRAVLNAALYTWPATLAVQPNGSTNVAYFEIYKADVQETPHFINEEAGRGFIRATVTWTRAPHAMAASLKTLINAATFTNVGTGANNNTQSLGVSAFSPSTTDGDRVYQGTPMNIKVGGGASTNLHRLYLASVLNRYYVSVNTSNSTTSSNPWGLSTVTTLDAATHRTRVRGRLLARFTTFTASTKIRIVAFVMDQGGTLAMLTSPKIAMENSTASFADFGWFDLDPFRRHFLGTTAPQVKVEFILYSTDGTNVVATLDYYEILEYFDFCRVDEGSIGPNTSFYLALEQVNNLNGEAYVLSRPPMAHIGIVSGDQPEDWRVIRGRLPRAYVGAQLYLSWLASTDQHDKTNTCTVTAQLSPQYMTMRGAG